MKWVSTVPMPAPYHRLMSSFNQPDVDETYLCWKCVGEEFLRAQIQKEGVRATCSFCMTSREAFGIEKLGDVFDLVFKSHFRRTSPDMTNLQQAQMRHGLLDWPPDREGEPVLEVLKSIAMISQEAAEVIQVELEGRYGTREDYEMQNETEFDSESHYEETNSTTGDWHEQWRAFERELRENARYFSNEASATLRRVFDGICDLRTQKSESVIVEAGPGTPMDALMRARVFHDREKMGHALEHPDKEIGPPPFRLAKAGRMNPGGISTFYGSQDKEAAVAEVRPVVGSSVVVGRFILVRKLRLLDLTLLGDATVTGSLFDPEYIRRWERVKFLGHLGHKMTRPVMPDDEVFEYLSTQVVCDFLATQKDLSLDGIIYKSVQLGYAAKNVVLFHHASRVEEIVVPKGAMFSSGPSQNSDDEDDFDYRVTVRLPEEDVVPGKPGTTPQDIQQQYEDLLEEKRRKSEVRPITLRVDLDALEVHEIESATFKTSQYRVIRHEWRPSRSTKYSHGTTGSQLMEGDIF
jgi:hypothetical protein